VLACDVPLPGHITGEAVICRLDVKKQTLAVFRHGHQGALELIREVGFVVDNLRYR
jgi:hypothetical protein